MAVHRTIAQVIKCKIVHLVKDCIEMPYGMHPTGTN